MKKLIPLFLFVLLSACQTSVEIDVPEMPENGVTIDLGEISLEEEIEIEAPTPEIEEIAVEAITQPQAQEADNVVLREYADFQGDGSVEQVVLIRSEGYDANLDYTLDLFVYHDNTVTPTLIKHDRIHNDSSWGESYFLNVEVTDLNQDGKDELFVNKILREENKYYVFGWNGSAFADFPIAKGYLNAEQYFGEALTEDYCGLKLVHVMILNGEIHEDYIDSCGEFTRLETVYHVFNGREFSTGRESSYKPNSWSALGEYSYSYEESEDRLYRDGVMVLDQPLRGLFGIDSFDTSIGITSQFSYEGSDYVFFKEGRGCGGCIELLPYAFEIQNEVVTQFTLENLGEFGERSCFAQSDVTLSGRRMVCTDGGEVFTYDFLKDKKETLFTPTMNLSYSGACMGLCEGDLYFRHSDDEIVVTVYRDAETQRFNQYATRVYDFSGNLKYEATRLE